MKLWPVGLARPLAAPTVVTTTTLFSLLAAFSLSTSSTTAVATPNIVTTSSALLLSTSSLVSASTSPPIAAANQRTFRLGHPAAALNKDASRFFSTMSSSTLPAQTESFQGFAEQPKLQPTPESAQLIKDAMDLFGAKPSPAIFARSWSPSAVFADPICHAEGSRQYLAQWYGMPAAFTHSETLEWKLTKQHDNQLHYVQKQRYKVKGLGITKDMVSTVVMQTDPNTGKIVHFEDRWNHKPLGGILGWPFRRLNAFTLPLLVGVPKETKQAVQSGTAPVESAKDL